MARFLTFGFEAPMGSFGNVGAQKVRETASWPQKSTILGICAAALGVARADLEARADLSALRLATLSRSGQRFIDYQTASGIHGDAEVTSWDVRHATDDDKTTDPKLRRHYLSDISVRVALADARGRELIDRIAEALRFPRYPLYCGRRSCPVASLTPAAIVEAPDAEAALWRGNDQSSRSGWTLHSDTDIVSDMTGTAIYANDQPDPASLRGFLDRRVMEKSYSVAWETFDFEDLLK